MQTYGHSYGHQSAGRVSCLASGRLCHSSSLIGGVLGQFLLVLNTLFLKMCCTEFYKVIMIVQ
jgi:hypothetical protein